jgi:asparagine synthase (glutamine-hydrolysing)
MCGIAGFIGMAPDEALLLRMSDAVSHRGPDDSGIWLDPANSVALAHRRLSIIDLSPAGHQPLWDVEQRAVIVFNGEIYNHRELQAGLERDGYRFRGHSDTETLVNLYLRDGPEFVSKLNGIFAFALWDPATKRLLLARDGVGVKPLYVARTDAGLAFASELKALLPVPGLDRSLDPEAVAAHLGLVYAPCPRTLFRGARKWMPGHAALFDPSGRCERQWCFFQNPVGPQDSRMTEAEAKDGLLWHLEQAVRRQLAADVKVGAFLSGGLDSSAIAHFARNALGGADPLECFTIEIRGGSSGRDAATDDLPYAKRVAEYLGVPLQVVTVDSARLMDFDKMVWWLDEPQPDPAALNAYFIAKLARERGIKVLLSGAGGDDIFTGYRRHYALTTERGWGWLPGLLRTLLRTGSGLLPQGRPFLRRVTKTFRYADQSVDERLAGYFLWLDDPTVRGLLAPDFAASLGGYTNLECLADVVRSLPRAVTPLTRMLQLDQRYFLTDHNLNYTDKMGMAIGVEARVPFLDPDLMAFAARIPDRLKQRGRVGKWIFKEAMLKHLPRDIVYRPKSGFGAPLRQWLHGDLAVRLEEYLTSHRIGAQGVFNPKAVRALMAADLDGRVDAAYPLFGVLCIDSWLQQFR